MGFVEKPALDICGKPMIAWVLDILRGRCKRILLVLSPHARRSRDLCVTSPSVVCIEGVGDYVEDLDLALSQAKMPALVMPSDVPLIDGEVLESFLKEASRREEAVVNLVGPRGPIGVSLFNRHSGDWVDLIVNSDNLFDIDTWEDFEEATMLCGGHTAGGRRGA